MAHGYTMVTGRPQAVMLHTNVGTANAINALIDAAATTSRMLLTSGRTPVTEDGPSGARNVYIHWAQEMFDQAGMLREVVKWDYELRRGDQVAEVVDRAMELATASPTGPVYLSLPREVLGAAAGSPADAPRRRAPGRPPRAGAEDVERGGGMDRRRTRSADHHRPARARSARGTSRWRALAERSRCRWCRSIRAISRCPAVIRCSRARRRDRCWPRRT